MPIAVGPLSAPTLMETGEAKGSAVSAAVCDGTALLLSSPSDVLFAQEEHCQTKKNG